MLNQAIISCLKTAAVYTFPRKNVKQIRETKLVELKLLFYNVRMQKAVFLDRDGIIIELPKENETHGFTYRKEDCYIIPGVQEILKAFKEKGYLRIVITNQPCIARGIVSWEEMGEVHNHINRELGGLIDSFYTCPHHPEMHPDVPEHAKKYRVKCDCRKPAPGLILEAARKFDIDTKQSWMVGDMITDVLAGSLAGCKTVLVKSPASERIIISTQTIPNNFSPDYIVFSFQEAARVILGHG